MLADVVRWAQHGIALFLLGFPLLVVFRRRAHWLRRLPLRLLHAALYAWVAGNACLGYLSTLSVLEWELRDRAAGTESSWFDVPVSDPVAAAAKLLGNTALVPAFLIPFGLFILATFWMVRPSGGTDSERG
ncbi:hypothetical protein Poly30_50620 [Planctomycetes bacterium Poly30]|uniref:Uncharacterized protein n=2 Tax=Saltatorellus ferox TaxID=2528018 RepID=A0A518EZJ9_9BACT|nr:hypothetical protein Poly30_50620 [Planctomycetes bacterium Poly30]